jgi:hypothetical protein
MGAQWNTRGSGSSEIMRIGVSEMTGARTTSGTTGTTGFTGTICCRGTATCAIFDLHSPIPTLLVQKVRLLNLINNPSN